MRFFTWAYVDDSIVKSLTENIMSSPKTPCCTISWKLSTSSCHTSYGFCCKFHHKTTSGELGASQPNIICRGFHTSSVPYVTLPSMCNVQDHSLVVVPGMWNVCSLSRMSHRRATIPSKRGGTKKGFPGSLPLSRNLKINALRRDGTAAAWVAKIRL